MNSAASPPVSTPPMPDTLMPCDGEWEGEERVRVGGWGWGVEKGHGEDRHTGICWVGGAGRVGRAMGGG